MKTIEHKQADRRFQEVADKLHGVAKRDGYTVGPPQRKPDTSGQWLHASYGQYWSTAGIVTIEHSHQAGFFWRKGKMGASMHTGWREFSGVFMKIVARRTTA